MTSKTRVWVVDDDRSIRWVLEKALKKAQMDVEVFANANDILDRLEYVHPHVIISDIRMPGIDGIDLLERIHQQHPNLPVIIMTAHSDLDSAVSAYQGGAFEYLPKPFDVDDAIDLVKRALDQQKGGKAEETAPSDLDTEIVGEAPAMQEVFRAIGRLSRSNITVLITGESGTGKELIAQALHRHSPRSNKPFIAINTAAIPKDLLESELFGHEKGSFTGAQAARRGRFEQANGGTLFLDEIGDMPLELQTRLLRVLASGEFYRVGGHEPVKVEVRVIAATHQNLENAVKEGTFREDLFHRLNVIRIQLPALRERREDVHLLLGHFLNLAASEMESEVKILSKEAQDYLCSLDWPGNVRQLENVCRWLTVMAPGREVFLEDLPQDLRNESPSVQETNDWEGALKLWTDKQLQRGSTAILDVALPKFEQVMINSALDYTSGHRQEAARLLGWGRNTLTRKIKELNMEDEHTQAAEG
ncbi:MAG: nitrogen regulation protein NR(I) [Gammaproteobacteria bacterium]|nr:nitrogen regulation protein NR(I) [Gammaproteobacteria bacterium]MDH5692563.1 nitrogen regulation protein NR(I) [Gammaproteobacteria bacterium]